MNDQLRAVGDYAIALEITLVVEKLDPRVTFCDDDIEDATHLTPRQYLRDTIAVVEKAIARLPESASPPSAEELVFKALRQLCPSIEQPSRVLSLEEIGKAMSGDRRTKATKNS